MDQKGYQIHQAWLCVFSIKWNVKHIWGSRAEKFRWKFPFKTPCFHKHHNPAWRGGLKKLLLLLGVRIVQLGWTPLINSALRKSSSAGLCILCLESKEAKGFKSLRYFDFHQVQSGSFYLWNLKHSKSAAFNPIDLIQLKPCNQATLHLTLVFWKLLSFFRQARYAQGQQVLMKPWS